jgi:hypothetical protein
MNNPVQDKNRVQAQVNDHDHVNANDNDRREDKVIAPTPPANALVSLTALQTAFNNVDMTAVGGRSTMSLLQFKSRENGTWMFGQKRTVPEEGSRWAINLTTFEWGWICFGDGNKRIGEKLVSVSKPMPLITDLPDKGFPWQEQRTVNAKCIDGADAGVEVTFVTTTEGGKQVVGDLIETIRDRLNNDQHGGNVVPVVTLGRDSYPHPQHGRIWRPVLRIVGWMPLSGPASAPVPTPPPAPVSPAPTEQPRRRRVV